VHLLNQADEIAAAERPLERSGNCFIMSLEGQNTFGELLDGFELGASLLGFYVFIFNPWLVELLS
jgi:hypothetical protein